MRRELEIKGESVEEKFKNIETILRRLYRRVGSRVVGVLPISPIIIPLDLVKPTTIILPVRGKILKAAIYVDKVGNGAYKVKVISSELDGSGHNFVFTSAKSSDLINVNIDVKAGTSISAVIERMVENVEINSVTLTLLFQPHVLDAPKIERVIDENL